jgi:iron complex transport system substrate-binding protein
MAKPGTHSLVVTADQVEAATPDLVIVAPCGFPLARALDEASRLVAAHGWLADRDVWAIDANALTSRPGPHLVDGIETMARLIAPSLFTPVDLVLAAQAARRPHAAEAPGPRR